MAVITFVNDSDEETGKTMALVAIATDMAIEYNHKILVISTTNKKDDIERCFFKPKQEITEKEQKKQEQNNNMKKAGVDVESGAAGLRKNDKK